MTTIIIDHKKSVVYTDSCCTSVDGFGIKRYTQVEKAWYCKGGVIFGTGSLDDLIDAKYLLSRNKEPKRFAGGTTVVYARKAYRINWHTERAGKVSKSVVFAGKDDTWTSYGSGATLSAILKDYDESIDAEKVFKYISFRDDFTNNDVRIYRL